MICDITDLPDHNLRGEPPKCGSAPAGGRVRRDRRVPRSRGQGLRARRWNARRGSCRHGAGARGCLGPWEVEPFGFPGEKRGVVAVKPVGDQKHDGPLPQHPARPVAVEGVERLSDPGAAGPVLRLRPGGFQGGVHVTGWRRWRVMFVSRVPKVKAWTRAQPCPLRLATAWTKCRTMRE